MQDLNSLSRQLPATGYHGAALDLQRELGLSERLLPKDGKIVMLGAAETATLPGRSTYHVRLPSLAPVLRSRLGRRRLFLQVESAAGEPAMIQEPDAGPLRDPVSLLVIGWGARNASVLAEAALWIGRLQPEGLTVFEISGDSALAEREIAAAFGPAVGRCIARSPRYLAFQRQPAVTAEAILRSRAAQHGLDGDQVIARLRYGSFVSLQNRFVYVETPKAACTTLKRLVADLEGLEPDGSLPPLFRLTTAAMRIHERSRLALPGLDAVDEQAFADIIKGDAGWFVFAAVRNPMSRVVSVFENKIRLGEPDYRHLEARYGASGPFRSVAESFRAFVAEVIAVPSAVYRDPHLAPQTGLLLPDIVPYTEIFQVERFYELVLKLQQHLLSRGTPKGVAPQRLNDAITHHDWRDYYDEATAATVAAVYASDFARFGYDRDSWRKEGTSPLSLEDSADLLRWRAEVVRRNAMIDELYDRLKRLSAQSAAKLLALCMAGSDAAERLISLLS